MKRMLPPTQPSAVGVAATWLWFIIPVEFSSVQFGTEQFGGRLRCLPLGQHTDTHKRGLPLRILCNALLLQRIKFYLPHTHTATHWLTHTLTHSATLIKLMPPGTFASGALPPSNFNMSVHSDGCPRGMRLAQLPEMTGSNWLLTAAETKPNA